MYSIVYIPFKDRLLAHPDGQIVRGMVLFVWPAVVTTIFLVGRIIYVKQFNQSFNAQKPLEREKSLYIFNVIGSRSLTVQPNCVKGGIVCGTGYVDRHYRSPGINRKSRILNPGPRFLSSAAWLKLMPTKHSSGFIAPLKVIEWPLR